MLLHALANANTITTRANTEGIFDLQSQYRGERSGGWGFYLLCYGHRQGGLSRDGGGLSRSYRQQSMAASATKVKRRRRRGGPGSRRRRRRGGAEGRRWRQKTTAVVDGVLATKHNGRGAPLAERTPAEGWRTGAAPAERCARWIWGKGKTRSVEERIGGSSTRAWAHEWLGLFGWPNLASASSTLYNVAVN
ncbi:hypothetical protein DAI22_01g078900 [Oryza sativa Japonica Group]|nr:hypothetical protein DAI22_01g078900 [Oryza sativa Japonica Group]